MVSRLSVLVAVALVLMCISFAITFWPNVPSQNNKAIRDLAAIGGRYTKNDDGNVISVTLEGITDDTFVACLQVIRRDLESLTFRNATLEQEGILRRMGPFPRLVNLRLLDCSFQIAFPPNTFPSLESLVISESTLPDYTLLELLTLRLHVLKISKSQISPESLEAIAKMNSLRELLLSRNTGFTDRSLARLAGLQQLRELYLHRSRITGSGFAAFPSDSKLQVLYVYGTDFDSIGCENVTRFKELRFLAAGGTKVSAVGITRLARLKKLERLNIPISAVTEESASVLEAMPSLKTLALEASEKSSPEIQRLNTGWFPEWHRKIIGNAVVLTRGE